MGKELFLFISFKKEYSYPDGKALGKKQSKFADWKGYNHWNDVLEDKEWDSLCQ